MPHMESGSSQIRSTKSRSPGTGGRQVEGRSRIRWYRTAGREKGDGTMQPEARSLRLDAVQAHPLAELLECPPRDREPAERLGAVHRFRCGDVVFRQRTPARGSTLWFQGSFCARTERLDTRLTLGPARAGDLVELAAALGDGPHLHAERANRRIGSAAAHGGAESGV
jgi:hypothetical protein